MPDAITTTPAAPAAPTNGLTANPPAAPPPAAAPAAAPPKEAPKNGEQKAAPTSAEWNKLNAAEKTQRREQESLKKQREDLTAQQTALAASQAEIDAVKSGDVTKIMALLGGVEGYNKLSTALLKQRADARKAGAPPPTQGNIDAIVAKAIADHEAKKEATAAEATAKAEAESKKATDARFAQLSTECAELIAAGGERFTQLQLETGKQAGILETMLREVESLITRPDGWTVGGKTLKGRATLDEALDLLEDALVERAATFASAKVRARLAIANQAEKPAEQGGTRKSESGGPTTLTTRLSQESSLTSRPADAAAPPGESPLARRQREDREALERAIADTSAILSRKK